ncbi:MAG: ABC transporter substrate-binding protein [Lyngbya sp.]|nr:ABC transporter substrate-binding protein [Lyngbya sp.]
MLSRRYFVKTSSFFSLFWMLGAFGEGSQAVEVLETLNQTSLDSLTLQLDWKYNVQFAGVLLADYYQLYRKQGLKIDIQPWDFGVDVLEIVAENPTILGCAEQDVILAAQAAGKPIKAVATMFQTSPLGLMSMPDNNIASLQDLVGKKVGVHGDTQKVMDLVMGYSKLPPDDIEVVDISYDEKYDKLLTGEVDAVQCYLVDEPIGFAYQTGIEPTVIRLSDYGYDAYVQTIFAHNSLLETQREQVKAFLKATFQGWKLALENIPKAAEIVVENYVNPKSKYNNLDYQTQSLELISEYITLGESLDEPLGLISTERWRTMSERLVKYNIIKTAPTLSDSIDLTLWSV